MCRCNLNIEADLLAPDIAEFAELDTTLMAHNGNRRRPPIAVADRHGERKQHEEHDMSAKMHRAHGSNHERVIARYRACYDLVINPL